MCVDCCGVQRRHYGANTDDANTTHVNIADTTIADTITGQTASVACCSGQAE